MKTASLPKDRIFNSITCREAECRIEVKGEEFIDIRNRENRNKNKSGLSELAFVRSERRLTVMKNRYIM